jgi:hypothetical protein
MASIWEDCALPLSYARISKKEKALPNDRVLNPQFATRLFESGRNVREGCVEVSADSLNRSDNRD